MVQISTQTWDEAAQLLGATVLVDYLQILDVGEPVTSGPNVTRDLTPVGEPIHGIVQSTVLANAVESRTVTTYAVKVARGTELRPGQAVKVINCLAEPDLAGKVLLLDKVSQNGIAIIRKAVASDFEQVNQEGKEGLR